MRTIKSSFFCMASSSIMVVLISILIALHHPSSSLPCTPLPTTSNYISLEAALYRLKILVKTIHIGEFLSVVTQIRSAQWHHHLVNTKMECDGSIWNSNLIVDFQVSKLLTVDLKGCGDFTSVQKAVDSVPDFSNSRTLIILDSGTYRSLFFF